MEHFHGRTIPYGESVGHTGSELSLHFLKEEKVVMQSNHIDNRRLFSVVNESAILDEAELEHLSTCEECLELIRVLVRQSLSKSTGTS